MGYTGPPPPRWQIARPLTIRLAILRTERRLLADLDARERADEVSRLAHLRALLRAAR